MKILSFHPFSIYGNGGSSRILRRLYEGRESQVTCLAISTGHYLSPKRAIIEKNVTLIPARKKWMRWKVRDFAAWLRDTVFRTLSVKRIIKNAGTISFDVLHAVDHGPFSSVLCDNAFLTGKELWVSFHDHFSTNRSSFNNANQLWNKANRRLVISDELGYEYNRLFGKRDYEIITDGVAADEISKSTVPITSPITIYFAGIMHLEYWPLFQILADSLDILAKEGLKFKLILRGVTNVDFLNNRLFETEYRPFTINYQELKDELDSSTILYLPIKFTIPDFYLYSFSTKMIGYLAAPGNMLYHGPADSAICKLLEQTGSAVGCYTLNGNDMLDSLKAVINENCGVSANAKKLLKSRFDLTAIKERFWRA